MYVRVVLFMLLLRPSRYWPTVAGWPLVCARVSHVCVPAPPESFYRYSSQVKSSKACEGVDSNGESFRALRHGELDPSLGSGDSNQNYNVPR